MEAIKTFLLNTYGIFVVIAIFATLALIGYIVESKTGVRKRIVISSSKPERDIDNDIQKLKSDLSSSNKGLSSMMNNHDSSQNGQNPASQTPNVIKFDQTGTNTKPDKL